VVGSIVSLFVTQETTNFISSGNTTRTIWT